MRKRRYQHLCVTLLLMVVIIYVINYETIWIKTTTTFIKNYSIRIKSNRNHSKTSKREVVNFLNDREPYFDSFIPNYLIPSQNASNIILNEAKLEFIKTYEKETREMSRNLKPKIILWYVRAAYTNVTPRLKPLNCPDKCVYTTNRFYHNVSSALLWNAHVFEGSVPKKLKDQVFVLHNDERQCALHHKYSLFQKTWKSQFNWTMAYRNDSDIVELYGLIMKRKTLPNKDYDRIFENKTKMAVVLISHCPSQSGRMKYIEKLRKYGVEIDIYGGCGTINCPRAKDEECFKNLTTKYKFFLSFENSFCPEYITEKLFRFFQTNIVLVVRGGADYSKVTPKDTFLNTKNFNTTKDLANRILQLSKDKAEYISLLKRKDEYESLTEKFVHLDSKGKVIYVSHHYGLKSMCYLCHRLWNLDSYPRKWYDDVTEWFKKRDCYLPDDTEP